MNFLCMLKNRLFSEYAVSGATFFLTIPSELHTMIFTVTDTIMMVFPQPIDPFIPFGYTTFSRRIIQEIKSSY